MAMAMALSISRRGLRRLIFEHCGRIDTISGMAFGACTGLKNHLRAYSCAYMMVMGDA